MVEKYTIHEHDESIPCERRGRVPEKLIFTHGAFGCLETPEMSDFADGFSQNLQIVSFEGSLTNLRSRLVTFNRVLESEKNVVAIGGRSMGSRAAALTATHALSINKDTSWAKQLVLVSFPLIGKKHGDSREDIILNLPSNVEVLFVCGDKDSMCNIDLLSEVRSRMSARSWLLEVSDTNHTLQHRYVDETIGKKLREESGKIASNWLLERDCEKLRRRIKWDEHEMQIDDSDWC